MRKPHLHTSLLLIGLALALAGCGTAKVVKPQQQAPKIKPLEVFGAPKRTIALTPPQPNGSVWVLAGTSSVKTLTEFDVDTGAILRTFGVSAQSSDIAQLASGDLAIAINAISGGSVEIISSSTGKTTSTIPTSGPIHSVAVASDGSTVYALESVSTNRAVITINSASGSIGTTYPVPSTTIAALPLNDQSAIWVLQQDGLIDQISAVNKQIATQFITGAPAAAFAISPDGSRLYVLRASATAPNVAVVNTATEADTKVLPAPRYANDVVISPDGSTLYESVGNVLIGNIQSFTLSS